MQCGTEDIAVVDGATTDCTVTDPLTGLEFDAVVTISDTIICQEDPAQFTIEEGTAIECKLIEAKTGARGVATITVTSIDGAAFNIDVNVVDP